MKRRQMESWLRVWLVALVVGACIGVGYGDDEGEDAYNRLVVRWKNERTQLLRKMTRAWLTGQETAGLWADLMALSRLESGLATRPDIFLYIGAIDDPGDVQGSVGAVARAYLRDLGALVDSAHFFRGRTFQVVKEGPSPDDVVAAAEVESRSKALFASRNNRASREDSEIVTEITTIETTY